VIIIGAIGFGTFYTPGMALLTNVAEARGLDYGYAFALLNLAWAPGQAVGSALGGSIAEATSDAVPYYILAGAALVTLLALGRTQAASARRLARHAR
jgi:MFS family permease